MFYIPVGLTGIDHLSEIDSSRWTRRFTGKFWVSPVFVLLLQHLSPNVSFIDWSPKLSLNRKSLVDSGVFTGVRPGIDPPPRLFLHVYYPIIMRLCVGINWRFQIKMLIRIFVSRDCSPISKKRLIMLNLEMYRPDF